MSSFSVTGDDTIQIAGRVLTNFGDGDVGKVSFPNEKVGVKTGKGGNSVFAANAMGQLAEVILRVLRGSPDDTFLNSLLVLQDSDLPSFPLMDGYVVKRIGDGQGNVANDTTFLKGGVFTKNVETDSNVEGQTDQALAIYNFKFANSERGTL